MAVSLKKPNDELDKFLLRMPDGLRNRIKFEAEKNNRSMNAEIVATLEEAYPDPGYVHSVFWEEFVRPILSQKDREERHSMLDQANDYLHRFDQDLRLSLANVDGVEQLVFVQLPSNEPSTAS